MDYCGDSAASIRTLNAARHVTLGHHRNCLDFDLGTVFDKCRDLDERHGREMPANHLAVGFADLAKASEILVLVRDIPSKTHDAPGSRTGLSQYGDDVGQGLPDLDNKIIALELLLTVPADLARHADQSSFGNHAVGEALGAPPVFRV